MLTGHLPAIRACALPGMWCAADHDHIITVIPVRNGWIADLEAACLGGAHDVPLSPSSAQTVFVPCPRAVYQPQPLLSASTSTRPPALLGVTGRVDPPRRIGTCVAHQDQGSPAIRPRGTFSPGCSPA